jgi:hypothetical protein
VREWSLADSATSASHEQLESIVRDTLNALHLSAVASSERSDVGADFAVWDDALESLGTPILIEVKTDVRGPILQQAQGQLQRQLEKGNASFGLLLWELGRTQRFSAAFSAAYAIKCSAGQWKTLSRVFATPSLTSSFRWRAALIG